MRRKEDASPVDRTFVYDYDRQLFVICVYVRAPGCVHKLSRESERDGSKIGNILRLCIHLCFLHCRVSYRIKLFVDSTTILFRKT